MPTLANIQGGSLVPNISQALRQDITSFRERNRAQEAQTDLASQLRTVLGGEPSQAPAETPVSGALGILGELNPQIAQMIGQLTQSKDPKAVEEFRAENNKGLALSKELLALPDHASRLRRLSAEAGTVAAQGGDVNRLVDLGNKNEAQLQLELEKMQVIGNAALEAAPEIQTGGPTAFLSDPTRRAAFADIASTNPKLAQTLLAARDRELTRGATERDRVRQAAQPQTVMGKARQDLKNGLITQGDFNTLRSTPKKFQSKVGKLLGDQRIIVAEFGEGSPQAAAIAEAISSDAKGEKPKLSDVKGIRGQFTSLSGDFITMRDAVGKVRAASADPSAAGDLSLIFNYMKILDPNSVVRESEFATAANTAGVPDRVRNIWNKSLTGERLAEEQRKDFTNTAEKLFASQARNQNQLVEQFTGIAERANIDPRDVVVDFTGTAAAPSGVIKAEDFFRE